jgi:hypothetical protein
MNGHFRAGRHVSNVPIGNIAVKLLRSPCVAQFPSADTVCQLHENCRITVFGLRHVAIAYPCVGVTRNYSAAGFAQVFTSLWIGRSNLRLSERVCAVHYPVGVQSIDLGVR